MNTYVLLLRGINVGGKNKVSMAELRMYLEDLGFEDVKSFINSGNILLRTDLTHKQIADKVEDMLPKKFKLDSSLIKVSVLSDNDLRSVIKSAPKGFGTEPDKYHSDVIFLMGVTAEEAWPVFSPREGVDKVWPGKNVIYSQRLSTERTKSRLNKITAFPLYKSMTIRSWSTTTKLLALLDATSD